MNIYFIPCEEIWPVGGAGAVVVANDPGEALTILPDECRYGGLPIELIGVASEKYTKPEVVFYNSTEY